MVGPGGGPLRRLEGGDTAAAANWPQAQIKADLMCCDCVVGESSTSETTFAAQHLPPSFSRDRLGTDR